MKKHSVDRILKSIDEQFQRIGFNNWDDGVEFAVAVLGKFVDLLRDRPNLEALLSNEPEPSPDDLEQMLNKIEQMFHVFRKQTIEFGKRMPHDPGGRRSILGNPSEQERRCEQVLGLIAKKVKTTDALKRVAQREGISLSSMNRIWRARGSE